MLYIFLAFLTLNAGIIVDLDDLQDDPQLMKVNFDLDNLPIDEIDEIQQTQVGISYDEQLIQENEQSQDNIEPKLQFQFTEEQNDPVPTKNRLLEAIQTVEEPEMLNWKIFADALSGMLTNIQAARTIEAEMFDRKQSLFDKIRKLHDRDESKLQTDIARINKKLTEDLEPLKEELSRTLDYRKTIYNQIADQKRATKDEQANSQRLMKVEFDEITSAQETVDQMIETFEEAKIKESSFIEIGRVQEQHAQVKEIFERHHVDFISDLVESFAQLLTTDLKQRKALKEAQELLEKLRSNIIDYKLQLLEQKKKSEEMFEERKETILNDKSTNDEIYNSKLEQYNSIVEQVSTFKEFVKSRQTDRENNLKLIEFYKSAWQAEQDVQNTLQNKLRGNAAGVNQAMKSVGNGIDFEGVMTRSPRDQSEKEDLAEEDIEQEIQSE